MPWAQTGSILQLGQTLGVGNATLTVDGEILNDCVFNIHITYRIQPSYDLVVIPDGTIRLYDDQGEQWPVLERSRTITDLPSDVTGVASGQLFEYDLRIGSPIQPAEEYSANVAVRIEKFGAIDGETWGFRWDWCQILPLPPDAVDPH